MSVEATPLAADQADAFDIRQFEHLAHVLRCDGYEHVLFSDGLRHLQLGVTMGTVLDGPVYLRYALSGLRGVETKVLTLRRFCHLCRFGRFSRTLYPPERRAPRWAMLLRAWDGIQAGASQREIAATLFGENAVHRDWAAGFLRTRVQRLIRGAEKLIGGGYRQLLQ